MIGARSMFLRICWLVLLALLPASLRAQSADARLRALYTAEWNWRQSELAQRDGGGADNIVDHFPRVDPAAQQARLAYWTRALATLDGIPLAQLSPEERIN